MSTTLADTIESNMTSTSIPMTSNSLSTNVEKENVSETDFAEDFVEDAATEEAPGIERFKAAQDHLYEAALAEIKNGAKRGHWVWYIWPQIQGLGMSWTARYYAIRDLNEASEYFADPLLHDRLIEITNALYDLNTSDLHQVLGSIDTIKVRSSMTLFELVAGDEKEVFARVLERYFGGRRDELTFYMLGMDNAITNR